MLTSLPLIFKDGLPTIMEWMSDRDLHLFLNFLIQCSNGYDTMLTITKPDWWPFALPFWYPTEQLHVGHEFLMQMIQLCYSYHSMSSLINVSTNLALLGQQVVHLDNLNGTSSVFGLSDGHLLAIYRNEMRLYDSDPSILDVTDPYRWVRCLQIFTKPRRRQFFCRFCKMEYCTLETRRAHEDQCLVCIDI